MMFSKYVIKYSVDGGVSFRNYAYYEDIKSAIDGLAYVLKHYPNDVYQLYEYIPTRIE